MSFLKDIIDPQGVSFDAIGEWLDSRLAALAATDFTPELLASFVPLELHSEFAHPLGPEAFADWRRFFLATLLADWACYNGPVDRIDMPRLKYIMTSAHRYFRLWVCRLPDGKLTPVGYTAWYPIAKFVHDGVLADTANVDDRGAFLPLRFVKPEDARYGYVINISIIKQLRNTAYSRRVIRAFQRDALRYKHLHLIAVTVDEAGRKMSRITDFSHFGEIVVQGESEALFVKRPT